MTTDQQGGPRLVPGDPDDEALRREVHPSAWINPTPKPRYHLFVIGAGTGGLVTAAAAAGLGAKVALVERHLMGGDCLNVGCVPSKAVVSAARGWHAARAAAGRFGGPEVVGDGDFGRVMRRMRSLRAGLAPIDGAARFQSLGVDVFLGPGRFVSPGSVEVGAARLDFRRAVIATGARAALPAIPGLESVDYLTNESVFALTERPRRLAIIGAGPIGCELAQAFARLGTAVTLLTRGSRILPRDDARAAAVLTDRFRQEGIAVITGATIGRVEGRGRSQTGPIVVHLNGPTGETRLEVDHLLVATGRSPNVEHLGLDLAGVRSDTRGVTVDDRLRTSNPAIYAVGDVCSPLQFTHAADFQARLVVQNALFFGRGRASRLVVPWATYTSPEVAQVGLTEEAAQAAGVAFDRVEVDFAHLDRATLEGETDGFVKLVLAKGSDRILGATVVAPDAGDLIAEVTLAMTNGLGLGAMGRTIHPYPTHAEAFRKAADQWRRRKLTPTVRGLFRRWFSLLR